MYQAPVPPTIFRSNSKFNEICNALQNSLIITTFCTRHDSNTVVTCAKFRCDRLEKFCTTPNFDRISNSIEIPLVGWAPDHQRLQGWPQGGTCLLRIVFGYSVVITHPSTRSKMVHVSMNCFCIFLISNPSLKWRHSKWPRRSRC